MKSIGLMVWLALGLMAGTEQAGAQACLQHLSFSLVGEYQFNAWSTNVATKTTNETTTDKGLAITMPNVVKAIAIDLEGEQWTNWAGSSLVREINLTTGAEGMFLRKSATLETNVSSFFGDSFSNDFTADIGGALGGFTNLLFYDNGLLTNITNSVYAGTFSTVSTHATVTNKIQSARLVSISLYTSNLKFNLLAFATTAGANFAVRYEGTNYAQWVDTLTTVAGVGNFAVNLGTNLYFGPNLYETTNFVSGPLRGTFSFSDRVFSTLPGP